MSYRVGRGVGAIVALLACGGPYVATTGEATSEATAGTRGESSPNATSTSGASGSTTASPDLGASTTADTTSDSASTTIEPCPFVCDGDIPHDPCDQFAQDCPEGQKCTATATGSSFDALACVEVMGDGLAGDPCKAPDFYAGEDTCAIGHICWHVDGKEGVCVAWCGGSYEAPTCAPACTSCVIHGDGILALCLPDCNPLLQDCPGDQQCIPDPAGYSRYQCWSSGGGEHPPGTPCSHANDCDPGSVCHEFADYPHPGCEGSSGCCGPVCDLNSPQCPEEPPGIACVPALAEPVACLEHVGVCRIP